MYYCDGLITRTFCLQVRPPPIPATRQHNRPRHIGAGMDGAPAHGTRHPNGLFDAEWVAHSCVTGFAACLLTDWKVSDWKVGLTYVLLGVLNKKNQ